MHYISNALSATFDIATRPFGYGPTSLVAQLPWISRLASMIGPHYLASTAGNQIAKVSNTLLAPGNLLVKGVVLIMPIAHLSGSLMTVKMMCNHPDDYGYTDQETCYNTVLATANKVFWFAFLTSLMMKPKSTTAKENAPAKDSNDEIGKKVLETAKQLEQTTKQLEEFIRANTKNPVSYDPKLLKGLIKQKICQLVYTAQEESNIKNSLGQFLDPNSFKNIELETLLENLNPESADSFSTNVRDILRLVEKGLAIDGWGTETEPGNFKFHVTNSNISDAYRGAATLFNQLNDIRPPK